jgi:hypothetical protein
MTCIFLLYTGGEHSGIHVLAPEQRGRDGLRPECVHQMTCTFYCVQVGSTVVSVYSPLNREEETDYALGVATKCLDIFNNFFGISYCLPKLDLIAVSCISVGKCWQFGYKYSLFFLAVLVFLQFLFFWFVRILVSYTLSKSHVWLICYVNIVISRPCFVTNKRVKKIFSNFRALVCHSFPHRKFMNYVNEIQ